MTPKKRWKIVWRALRVAAREGRKAAEDMALFGTGIVVFPLGGDPYCLPPDQVAFRVPPKVPA